MEIAKTVEKPWGKEIWLAHTDKYALKIIHFNKGSRSSLQYHRFKEEHIYIQSGQIRMEEEIDGRMSITECGPGSIIHNPAGKKHRVEALTDTVLIEVSTPELDDVIRVEDDYAR